MTARLTDAELRTIEARERAATTGPWQAIDRSELGAGGGTWRIVAGSRVDATLIASISEWDAKRAHADAQFCAAAREDMPRLLNEVRALKAERDEAFAEAEDFRRAWAVMREWSDGSPRTFTGDTAEDVARAFRDAYDEARAEAARLRELLARVVGHAEPEPGHAMLMCFAERKGDCVPLCGEIRAALAATSSSEWLRDYGRRIAEAEFAHMVALLRDEDAVRPRATLVEMKAALAERDARVRAATLAQMLPVLACDAAAEANWRRLLGLPVAAPTAPETRVLHEWRDGKCTKCGAGPGAPSLTHCGYATAERTKA